jgi:hypothetical protein
MVNVREREALGATLPLRRTSVARPALIAEARVGFGDLVAVTGRGGVALRPVRGLR